MSLDAFWKDIDAKLDRIIEEAPHNYQDLAKILPADEELAAAPAFFAGAGGDRQLSEALIEAGWRYLHVEAPYHYSMFSPTGSSLTYVEGDVYPGDQFSEIDAPEAEKIPWVDTES